MSCSISTVPEVRRHTVQSVKDQTLFNCLVILALDSPFQLYSCPLPGTTTSPSCGPIGLVSTSFIAPFICINFCPLGSPSQIILPSPWSNHRPSCGPMGLVSTCFFLINLIVFFVFNLKLLEQLCVCDWYTSLQARVTSVKLAFYNRYPNAVLSFLSNCLN